MQRRLVMDMEEEEEEKGRKKKGRGYQDSSGPLCGEYHGGGLGKEPERGHGEVETWIQH